LKLVQISFCVGLLRRYIFQRIFKLNRIYSHLFCSNFSQWRGTSFSYWLYYLKLAGDLSEQNLVKRALCHLCRCEVKQTYIGTLPSSYLHRPIKCPYDLSCCFQTGALHTILLNYSLFTCFMCTFWKRMKPSKSS
jgi:hypothetical protein